MFDHEVKLMGVFGASGSGKTTITSHLVRALNAPLQAIEFDNFFIDNSIPTASSEDCAVDATTPDDLDCWDRPESIDFDKLLAFVEHVLKATKDAVKSGDVNCEEFSKTCGLRVAPGVSYDTLVNNAIPVSSAKKTVWVVVEGFLLCCDTRLASLLDVAVAIEAPSWEVSCCLRFLRSHQAVVQHSNNEDNEDGAPNPVDESAWVAERVQRMKEAFPERFDNLPPLAELRKNKEDVMLNGMKDASDVVADFLDRFGTTKCPHVMEEYDVFRQWYFVEVKYHYDLNWGKQLQNAETALLSKEGGLLHRVANDGKVNLGGVAEQLAATLS